MFIRIILTLVIMSTSYAAPADRLLSPFDSLLLAFRARTPSFGVYMRRQTSDNGTVSLSDFPVQCQQGCAPAVKAINTCSSTTCICDPTVDRSLAYCVSCSVNANPTPSVIQTGQQFVDTYNTFCKGTGVSTISFSITATATATGTNGTNSSTILTTGSATGTSGTSSSTILTTTGNATPPPALGPTTTITVLPQTGTSTATPATISKSSNAPVIRPHAALASIGVAMVLFMANL